MALIKLFVLTQQEKQRQKCNIWNCIEANSKAWFVPCVIEDVFQGIQLVKHLWIRINVIMKYRWGTGARKVFLAPLLIWNSIPCRIPEDQRVSLPPASRPDPEWASFLVVCIFGAGTDSWDLNGRVRPVQLIDVKSWPLPKLFKLSHKN